MCGIAGILHADPARPVDEPTLRRMAYAIRHRGPDGYGIATDAGTGLVSTRLAIFDIPSGWQPMQGAHRDTVMVYNGEVFNHYELRRDLEAQGERFRTTSDTEILLRLLDREGPEALHRCNGQWGIAHLDRPSRTLTLMRDRFGVRPLHYALLPDGGIVFASEVKGILASGLVEARPDLEGIDEVFTTWAPRPPRCAFAGIRLLPPGHALVWRDGEVVEERAWWQPRYATDAPPPAPEALGELLRDSVRLRLRADVPVGCYLSGGLDSSLTTALAVEQTDHQLRTFSLAFRDPLFDESAFQRRVADELGTQHHVIEIGPEHITNAFQDVMRHIETPVIRSAGVPLYLLAQSTREQGITVVATGEGADELYWGYDLFKEAKVRAFCARNPDAAWRASLFDRMYPYFASTGGRRGESWRRFFLDAGPLTDPLFSHQTRIAATSGVKALYSADTRAALAGVDPLERLRDDLPEEFGRMSVLERAAYLEVTTLLSNHLLAAQADRVGMAHGIEGRFPFLDHRVFEHSVATRPQDKLSGLHEKIAVRRVAAEVVPPIVAQRPKQPYRAPEAAAFFADEPEWVTERLSPEAVRDVGIYDERAVAGLVRRCRAGRATGFRENMALMGVLSTQVWHATFCTGAMHFPEEREEPRVRLQLERLPVRVGSAA
jgi:asparagine synthase (glutamine-hydrolysing)